MTMNDTTRPLLVLKIGGNQVEDEAFLDEFAATVKQLSEQYVIIIVHGGGKEIADLHGKLGVPFQTVDGLRVTSEESLRLVEMVLNGAVNTRLVRRLVNAGVDAVGLNGVDMGIVRVTPMVINGQSLGRVGAIRHVNGEALTATHRHRNNTGHFAGVAGRRWAGL